MNIQLNNVPDHRGCIVSCCRKLAEYTGCDAFRKLLEEFNPDNLNDKLILEEIIKKARNEGFKTVVLKSGKELLLKIVAKQPVTVEMKDGSYRVVSGIERDNVDSSTMLILNDLVEGSGTGSNDQIVDPAEFLGEWAGGLLYFEPVNTALVCFSIVAREHKIELTQDRLRHEYDLGKNEIPANTLLRICKDHGLKAKKIYFSWENLINLKKAFPAIVRLRNGRHLVVAGAFAGEQPSAEVRLACYDPLAGANGGHLRLTRDEFEKVWAGETFIIKKIFKLNDENQPFSLRWFIPEILKQRTAFVDISLAVLFIHGIALITPIFFR